MGKWKGVLAVIAVHISVYILLTILWIFSFRTSILGSIDIFFYRGIGLVVIFGSLAMVLIAILRKCAGLSLTGRDVVLQFFIFCCVNTVLFTHLPVTAERSVSVCMLGYLAKQENEGGSVEEIEDYLERYYVEEKEAVRKRLYEQSVTGTVVEGEDGRYRITEGGITLMGIYQVIEEWFGIEGVAAGSKGLLS